MKNVSYRTDHLSEMATALLIRGVQMGEMSRRGWLFGLVKHAMWADFHVL
jgi:hypothetical protein